MKVKILSVSNRYVHVVRVYCKPSNVNSCLPFFNAEDKKEYEII